MRVKNSRSRLAAAVMASALGFTGLVAVAGASPAQATTTPVKACANGALPTSVKGAPTALKAKLATGAWVWHDANGWHVRVTHSTTSKLIFSGSVVATNGLAAKGYRLEGRDVLARSANHKLVTFSFKNYGGIDGFDFAAGCSENVRFTLNAGGKRLTTRQIHLGKAGVSPTSNPFTVNRS